MFIFLFRERVPAPKAETEKEKETSDDTEKRNAASVATKLDTSSPTGVSDNPSAAADEQKGNMSARSLMKSASISASKCIGVQGTRTDPQVTFNHSLLNIIQQLYIIFNITCYFLQQQTNLLLFILLHVYFHFLPIYSILLQLFFFHIKLYELLKWWCRKKVQLNTKRRLMG